LHGSLSLRMAAAAYGVSDIRLPVSADERMDHGS
jgi:hypothetical protein